MDKEFWIVRYKGGKINVFDNELEAYQEQQYDYCSITHVREVAENEDNLQSQIDLLRKQVEMIAKYLPMDELGATHFLSETDDWKSLAEKK